MILKLLSEVLLKQPCCTIISEHPGFLVTFQHVPLHHHDVTHDFGYQTLAHATLISWHKGIATYKCRMTFQMLVITEVAHLHSALEPEFNLGGKV